MKPKAITLVVFLILSLTLDATAQTPKPRYAKLASQLAVAVEAAEAGAPMAEALRGRQGIATLGTSTGISIRVSDPDAVDAWLQSRGVHVSNRSTDTLEVYASLDIIRELNAVEGVLRVNPIHRAQPRLVGQGPAAHNAVAWQNAGITGTAVRVGVIDIGFVGFSALMGTDLPASVTARCYSSVGNFSPNLASCQTATNHGTAVAEALIDVAPQVELYIANPISRLDFRQTVDWMTSQGVRIINFSAAWVWDGPGNGTSPFTDSPLVTADAAVAGGSLFVAAAGNEGQSTWWGPFVDANVNQYAEFGSPRPDDNAVFLQAGETIAVQLRWDDSWTAAARDIDLEVYDSLDNLIAFSTDYQDGTPGSVPFEFVAFTAPATDTYYVAVYHYTGTAPPWIQLQTFTSQTMEFSTARSIGNPAESANAGVLAVGAARWSTPSTIEVFSSQGPTPDGRTKPEIVGVDGADSVTYGPGMFLGTSQATPHVAGLGALVLQAFTSFTPSQVATYLKTNAAPRGAVPNNTWGFGLARLPSVPCTFALTPTSASFAPASGSATVTVTTGAGCAWTAVSGSGFVTVTSGASGTGQGVVGYSVAANGVSARSGSMTIGGLTFTVNQNGTGPTVTLDKTSLNAGAIWNGSTFSSKTVAQQVRLTQSGAGTISWTATPSHPWISVSAGSGTGSHVFSIDVIPSGTLPATGMVNGTVTLAFTGAGNTAGPITLSLNLMAPGTTATPIGSTDTPVNNATGVVGAVGFTGWSLDDIGIDRTTICRNGVAGETPPVDPRCGGAAQVYVGDAVFIDGARPDVQAAFPTMPQNSRAGWGFMVLTNMLPNLGNGTYVFQVYLHDRDGHVLSLGTRTITCANASSVLPFGTIDTPEQGATTTGSFFNFGWALTPQPKMIPFNGSTIVVFVDGVPIGNPSYNHFRADIAGLFPGLANTDGAIGVRTIDTTGLANGLHTIAWSVTDNQGAATGIGSRFFSVSNGASMTDQENPDAVSTTTSRTGALTLHARPITTPIDRGTLARLPIERAALTGRQGWNLGAPFQRVARSRSGHAIVTGEPLDRYELRLGTDRKGEYSGYLRVGDTLTALPIGSHLSAATGEFAWTPSVGFIGEYDLVFVRWDGGRAITRRDVRISLQPKTGPNSQ